MTFHIISLLHISIAQKSSTYNLEALKILQAQFCNVLIQLYSDVKHVMLAVDSQYWPGAGCDYLEGPFQLCDSMIYKLLHLFEW